MQAQIIVQNNNRLQITPDEFMPADYTIEVRIPHDQNLVAFLMQQIQNTLAFNGVSVSIGGDAIGC